MNKVLDKIKSYTIINSLFKTYYKIASVVIVIHIMFFIINKVFYGVVIKNLFIDIVFILFGPLILMVLSIPFLPAIFPIKYVFKKTKKVSNRICAISFFVPFCCFFYYLIGSLLNFRMEAYFIFLGCFLPLALILSTAFLVFLFISKKECEYKWNAVLTTVCTAGFSIIIFLTILFLNSFVSDMEELYKLRDYNEAIKYIENYKKNNGIYPTDINSLELKSKYYPVYQYDSLNEGSDFILFVKKSKYYRKLGYRYCSKAELPLCSSGVIVDEHLYIKKVGKWTHTIIDFVN